MNALQMLYPGVLALLACALLLRRARVLVWGAALVMSCQLMVAVAMCVPVLRGTAGTLHANGFQLDGIAALFVLLTSGVVTAALVHGIFYFQRERQSERPPQRYHVQMFYGFTALFLAAMYGAVTADNLAYLWICMEATTLVSAPLVYYHRSRSSLEATWKYLIICSVAIAFAFFGTALLYAASQGVPGLPHGALGASLLMAHAAELPKSMLRLGFVFMLLGYGTKAGLFPLHNWLPDAHSQAPGPASAMLSGALLNCAAVALWRAAAILRAAGDGAFVERTMLPLAVATVLTGSIFLLKQRDFKRLWAYSSMENMGLIVLAVALGCNTGFVFLAVNHSLAKVALFLLAGNLLQQFGSKDIDDMRGLVLLQPLASLLLLAGAVAVAGTPPFGNFLAEWNILSFAADRGYVATVVIVATSLAIAFIALCMQVSRMLLGETVTPTVARIDTWRVWPKSPAFGLIVPVMLLLGCLWFGLAPHLTWLETMWK